MSLFIEDPADDSVVVGLGDGGPATTDPTCMTCGRPIERVSDIYCLHCEAVMEHMAKRRGDRD